ncbi:hypothetical protein BU15DRAFT_68939 [Melanogaster broomeanus]|nr:hypothetical protein BU15DRAFT_68939 [Melanogaster broomeanus]
MSITITWHRKRIQELMSQLSLAIASWGLSPALMHPERQLTSRSESLAIDGTTAVMIFGNTDKLQMIMQTLAYADEVIMSQSNSEGDEALLEDAKPVRLKRRWSLSQGFTHYRVQRPQSMSPTSLPSSNSATNTQKSTPNRASMSVPQRNAAGRRPAALKKPFGPMPKEDSEEETKAENVPHKKPGGLDLRHKSSRTVNHGSEL